MKIAYVAGPYTADTAAQRSWNIAMAHQVAAQLWGRGYGVICPHANSAHMDGAAPAESFYEGDLEIIRRCQPDAFVLTPGWQQSNGTIRELAAALAMKPQPMFLGASFSWWGEVTLLDLLASSVRTVAERCAT